MPYTTKEYLESLVRELALMPNEAEWVEFKCNNGDPERIVKYISGLSNAAALCGKTKGYLVWGIDDETHKINGTSFNYRNARKGAEELEAWLLRMINPKINFKFHEVQMSEKIKVTLIEIPAASVEPTKYGSVAYVRVGTNLKPLTEYKEKERELWNVFDTKPFELRNVMINTSEDEAMMLLDYPLYYDVLGLPIPKNRNQVLEDLINEKFIKKNDAGLWDITNLGALLFAKDLRKFESIHRKAIRVIWYKGTTRLDGVREKYFYAGYAKSYEEAVDYILTIIPQEEVIDGATRKSVLSYPEIAIRELLANMIIHQDIAQRGTNPMVEIFDNRIEFSNAGSLLVAVEKIVNTVPKSRNENLAGFMHKIGKCEERGSGYDKVIDATSKNSLIAPRIENQDDQFTKVVLFSKMPFDITTKEDRIRTCYMLACLYYVNFNAIGNADIRSIFDLTEKESYKASRILKETMEAGLIKPNDVNAPRYTKYLPSWS